LAVRLQQKLPSILIHVFTALGAVAALFAVLALCRQNWAVAFSWLAVALVIDAVDGMLARHFQVKHHLPRFSGETLDLVIDYLNYVFVPALALLLAGFLTGWIGAGLAAVILTTALFHFADTESKADDYAFLGFPAVWNVVAFLIFAFDASPIVVSGTVLALSGFTFVRWPWVHPFRVVRLRAVTLAVVALSAVATVSVLWQGFPASVWQQSILGLAVLYFVAVPVAWRVIDRAA
jgi:phosphatidylcholine synthase